jgi:hypothetical protein
MDSGQPVRGFRNDELRRFKRSGRPQRSNEPGGALSYPAKDVAMHVCNLGRRDEEPRCG